MRFRSIELALFGALLTPSTACLTTSCTSDLRLHDVEVKRDLTVPFAEAIKLSFEACVGSGASSRYETVQVVAGMLGTGQVGGLVQGTVYELAGGKARVEAKIQVHDGVTSSPTPVSLRAADSSGGLVLDVTGQVRWEDEACHPRPLDSSI
jgi:hypothetical protein